MSSSVDIGGSRSVLAARVIAARVLGVAIACASFACIGVAIAAPAAAAPPAPRTPVEVVDDRGVALRLNVPPARIVSLLPSLTETVCELGACERLVGVDRYSNWPASVRTLPRLGGLDDTLIERLFALAPDLVLASTSARATDRLESLGLRVMALDSQSLDDVARTARRIARALGEPHAGEALVARLDAGIRDAAARIPPSWRGARTYVEVSSGPYAAGEASFIGALLARLGLANIVPAPLGPFPKLNPEFVVRAQPDLLMTSRRNLDPMRERPGWLAIDALAAGHVCAFDDARNDLMVRAGPRLAEAATAIADCVAALPARSAKGPQ
ncbi:MAG: ABC transporter substrate-binding protein [Lautropia sp.]